MKSIKPEEFFKLVALNSGMSDVQMVKDIYYGMLRTVSRELKEKQIVELPDWGKFVLKILKERRQLNVNTMQPQIVPPIPTVKFYVLKKMKMYFRMLEQKKS